MTLSPEGLDRLAALEAAATPRWETYGSDAVRCLSCGAIYAIDAGSQQGHVCPPVALSRGAYNGLIAAARERDELRRYYVAVEEHIASLNGRVDVEFPEHRTIERRYKKARAALAEKENE